MIRFSAPENWIESTSNSRENKEKEGEKVTEKVTIKVTKKVTINDTEKLDQKSLQIISLLQKNPESTTTNIAEKMSTSRKTVSIRLKKLCELGIVKRVGAKRNGRWEITRP